VGSPTTLARKYIDVPNHSNLSASFLCGATILLAADAKPAAPPATTTAATTHAAKPKLSINDITQKQIDEITYEDAEEDTGFITPLPPTWTTSTTTRRSASTTGPPSSTTGPAPRRRASPSAVRNLMHVCALADMIHSEFEGETAYVVFDKLKAEIDKDVLIKACGWMVLKPDEGRAVTKIPELGWEDDVEKSPCASAPASTPRSSWVGSSESSPARKTEARSAVA
jgi:hypothetical protein